MKNMKCINAVIFTVTAFIGSANASDFELQASNDLISFDMEKMVLSELKITMGKDQLMPNFVTEKQLSEKAVSDKSIVHLNGSEMAQL